jgi:hypothetical protein
MWSLTLREGHALEASKSKLPGKYVDQRMAKYIVNLK